MAVNISEEQLRSLARNANITYQNSSRGIVEEEADTYPDYASLDHSDLSLKGLSMRISSLKSVAKTGNFEDLLFPGNDGFKLKLNTATYLATNDTQKIEDTQHGFMSGEDKFIFDNFFQNYGIVSRPEDLSVINNRHNLVHREDAGYRHIPAGGKIGDLLVYTNTDKERGGTAVWEHHAVYQPLKDNGNNVVGGVLIDRTDTDDFNVHLKFTNAQSIASNGSVHKDNAKNNGVSTDVARADHVHDGRYVPADGNGFVVRSSLNLAGKLSLNNNISLEGKDGNGNSANLARVTSAGYSEFGNKDHETRIVGLNGKDIWYNDGTRDYYMVTQVNIEDQFVKGLANPIRINNTLFDGTEDIVTSRWGSERNIQISDADATNTSSVVKVDGSVNSVLKLPSTIKASLTGNADTASKLKAAVNINGTSFDGSKAITTELWGTSRKLKITDYDGTNVGVESSVNGGEDVSLKLPSTIKASLTGNADTASKLKTAVSINGTSFDGSKAITTTTWGTARNFTIKDASASNSGVTESVDGGSAVILKLPSIIKGDLQGNATTATSATLAAQATILQNTRQINGTDFNGSASITTAKWGTARNITISDSDGSNTKTTSSIDGSGNFTLAMPATIKATLKGNADTATNATTASQSDKIKVGSVYRTITVEGNTLKIN